MILNFVLGKPLGPCIKFAVAAVLHTNYADRSADHRLLLMTAPHSSIGEGPSEALTVVVCQSDI